ncbi:hypothetical protein BDB00DRAFT_787498 [Zychaea mexicana]|uniref:uncharacterized protein n=1 Tax=Zychaea mexicana TaxID=64656 RepID=UPI0022FEB1C4|nr:uncharacterized protein BDB00DRAFT_787498 [Zychaea mexicana]KAI9494068.1 hypothetical protein BDB00DRAFT_787498 [Zychaea mexicana]
MSNSSYYDDPPDLIAKSLVDSSRSKNSACPNQLCHLAVLEDSGEDDKQQIVQALIDNQRTLEYVGLIEADRGPSWSSVFRSLHLSNLHTLVCDGIEFEINALIAMLNQCPALDTLELTLYYQPATLELSTLASLATLTRLRSLLLSGFTFANELCVTTMLERFPALEKLCVYYAEFPLNRDAANLMRNSRLSHLELCMIRLSDEAQVIALSEFFSLVVCKPGLVTLRLLQMPQTTKRMLNGIPGVPTLRHLDIDLADVQWEAEQEVGLVSFVKGLQAGSIIQNLTFRGLDYYASLDDGAVIDALSELPFLNELALQTPNVMTAAKDSLQEDLDLAGNILSLLCKSKSLNRVVLYKASTLSKFPQKPTIDQVLVQNEVSEQYSVTDGDHKTNRVDGAILTSLTIARA